MPAKRFPIRGGFYALTDRHWSQQDVLNLHARPAEVPGTKTELELVHFGLRPHVEIGTGAVRGMRNVEGKRFVVSGTQLYEISATGVAIPRGYIPGIGRVSMAHNRYGGGHQLVIDNGAARYVYNTVDLTFVKVTDPSFPGSFCAFFVDQFLGYVAPQGDEWGHSDLNDATDYNDLDTYAAEADPDRIIWAHVSHREVLIFGKKTIEPYVNSPVGDGVAPFQRAANTVIPYGLSAKYSVVDMDGATFFVDQYLQVRELRGYQTTRISNAGVEEALAECPPSAIARGYAFPIEWGPHKFYVLTIPGHVTFVFDVWTREWVRKSSRGMPTWRLADCMYWEGQWIGGDATTGRLYTLDWDYPWDGTEELEREFSPGILFADQRGVEINEIEVLVTPGNPTVAVDTFPAQPTGPTLVLGAPDGTAGAYYTHTFTATGGTPPRTYSLIPGEVLPTGWALSSSGVLTCDDPVAGTVEPPVRVTDANGLWDEGTDELLIVAAPLMVTNTDSFDGTPAALVLSASYGAATGDGPAVLASTPSGAYCAFSNQEDVSASRFGWKKWNADTEAWDALADPADMPVNGPFGMAWSHDGRYLACAMFTTSPNNLLIYERSGDTLTKVAQAVGIPNNGYYVAWSADDSMLAVGNGNSAAGVYVFDIADGVLSNPRTANTAVGGHRVAFSPDGGHLAASTAADGLFVLSISPSALTLVDSDTAAESWGEAGVYWIDAGIVVVANQGGPEFINTWTFNGTVLAHAGEPASQPPSACSDSAVTGVYLAAACSGDDNVYVYDLTTFAAPSLIETQAVTPGLEAVVWRELSDE
jgi:hypothetical protein